MYIIVGLRWHNKAIVVIGVLAYQVNTAWRTNKERFFLELIDKMIANRLIGKLHSSLIKLDFTRNLEIKKAACAFTR